VSRVPAAGPCLQQPVPIRYRGGFECCGELLASSPPRPAPQGARPGETLLVRRVSLGFVALINLTEF